MVPLHQHMDKPFSNNKLNKNEKEQKARRIRKRRRFGGNILTWGRGRWKKKEAAVVATKPEEDAKIGGG